MGAATEACNNGDETGWVCDETIASALRVALVAFPIVAVLASVTILAARRRRQRRDAD